MQKKYILVEYNKQVPQKTKTFLLNTARENIYLYFVILHSKQSVYFNFKYALQKYHSDCYRNVNQDNQELSNIFK